MRFTKLLALSLIVMATSTFAEEAKDNAKVEKKTTVEATPKVEKKVIKEVKTTQKTETKVSKEVKKTEKVEVKTAPAKKATPKQAPVKKEVTPTPKPTQLPATATDAAKAYKISLTKFEICTSVKDRAPIGSADTFTKDIGKLFCFTHIAGVKDTAIVKHLWFKDGVPMGGRDLTIKSPSWRTWSIETITPTMTGKWRVDIIDTRDNSVIDSKEFTIQ